MKKSCILFGMLATLCLLPVGCSKPPEAKAISIFDSSTYTLPFTPDSVNWHGSGTDFVCQLTLEEMKDEIDGQDGITTELYERYLLIKEQKDNRTDYYVVTHLSNDSYDIEMPSFFSESNDLILYPKHLFGAEEFTEGKNYHTVATIEEFQEFYENTGVFTVRQTEKILTVEWNNKFPLSDGEEIKQGGATFTAVKYKGSSFTIEFTKENNVSYTVERLE